jgi:hypothetical protein
MWPLGWMSFIRANAIIISIFKVIFHSSFLSSLLCEVSDILYYTFTLYSVDQTIYKNLN